MALDPLHPVRLDWPSTIGAFILNFGSLDYLVSVLLERHLTPEDFIKSKGLHLNDRLEKILVALQTTPSQDCHHSQFADWKQRLKPIRELRNHIAHGCFYYHMGTNGPIVTLGPANDIEIPVQPNSRHLEFTELKTALFTLQNLTEELTTMAGFKDE